MPTIEIDKIVERRDGCAAKWVIVVRNDGKEWHTTLIEGKNDNGRPIDMKQVPRTHGAA